MDAYMVRYRAYFPERATLNSTSTWMDRIILVASPGVGITSDLIEDIKKTIVAMHNKECIVNEIGEIRYLGSAHVLLNSRDAVIDCLSGGFGGAMYQRG